MGRQGLKEELEEHILPGFKPQSLPPWRLPNLSDDTCTPTKTVMGGETGLALLMTAGYLKKTVRRDRG